MTILETGQWRVRDLVMGPGTPYRVLANSNSFTLGIRAPHTQERPHAHGSLVGSEWANARTVPIRVMLDAPPYTESAWLDALDELTAAFQPVGDSGEMVELYRNVDGREYVWFGRTRMVEPETDLAPGGYGFVQCAFVAADPRRYSAAESSLSTPLPVQQGGLTVPARVATTRLSLPGGTGSYASTPDDVSLDITGDIQIEVDVDPASWADGTQPLVSKLTTSGDGQRSWLFSIRSTGELGFGYSTDGTDLVTVVSTVPVPFSGRRRVRVTLNADNGAGEHVVVFEYASPGGPWIQLGAQVVGAGAVVMHSGTQQVEVGSSAGGIEAWRGIVYSVVVRNESSTVVADPDFTAQAFGATSVTDSTGKTWTLHGDAALVGDTYTGGLTAPMTVKGVLVGGKIAIENTGTAASGLRLRIDGPVPEPWIVLQTSQGVQRMDFDLTLAEGQWLDVTTSNRQALLNGLQGSNQRGRTTWDVDYFPLHPGTTTLRFGSSGSASDYPDAQVTAWWRSAWW